MYLDGCELHLETLTFQIVLILKQYVNAKPSEEVKFAMTIIANLTTYAASIPAHS